MSKTQEKERRKRNGITREDLTEMLKEFDAKPIFIEGQYTFKTKDKIQFLCMCGTPNTKQVREFDRGGFYCKQCQAEMKSNAISKARSLPEQVIKDPEREQICGNCHRVRPIELFIHKTKVLDEEPTVNCEICRVNLRLKDERNKDERKKRVVPEDQIETHQQCQGCYRIRPKTMYRPMNNNCNICNDSSRKIYRKWKAKAFEINNLEDEDIRMCVRCWSVFPSEYFVTELGNLGVVCHECRDDIKDTKHELDIAYLDIKNDMGKCVDCGNNDIRVLDFDHVDRSEKLRCVSEVRSIYELMEEAPKCVLRCAICHTRRTKQQLGFGKKFNPLKDFVDAYKICVEGCQQCHWFDETCLEALHFDHIDPSQKAFNISEMIKMPKMTCEEIENEIRKCQVLCANCHRKRTLIQFGPTKYDLIKQ